MSGGKMSPVVCFAFSSVLLLGFAAGFEWESEQFQYVTGCVGTTVTLPWRYRSSPGETIHKVYWTSGSGSTIGSRYLNGEVTRGADWPRVKLSEGITPGQLSLDMQDTRMSDAGYYSVFVTVYDKDGKGNAVKHQYSASIVLVLGEAPNLSGEALAVQEVTSADMCPRKAQTTLRCGQFSSVGFPPVDVVWTDPAGQRLPSSRFANGHFDLDLPEERLPGNYSCVVTCQSPVLKCLNTDSPVLKVPSLRVQATSSELCLEKTEDRHIEDLRSNLTTLTQAVVDLQNTQADILEDSASRKAEEDAEKDYFTSQIENLQDSVFVLNNSFVRRKTGLSELEQNVEDVREELTTLRDQQELQQHQQQDLQQHQQQQIKELQELVSEMRTQQAQDLDNLKEELLTNQKSHSLEETLSSLSETVFEVQNAVESLQGRQDSLESSHSDHRLNHSLGMDELWQNVDLLHELLNSTAEAVEDVWAFQEVLHGRVSTFSQNESSVDLEKEAALVSEVIAENNRTQQELSDLKEKVDDLEDKLVVPSGEALKEEMPFDLPDPLVARVSETFSVRDPSLTVVDAFVITPYGHVVIGDHEHNDVIIVPDTSSPDVIVRRPLKYGTHVRQLTNFVDGLVAATVNDNYILILDTKEPNPNKQERWIRTPALYHGIAARSRQTLYVSVTSEDSVDDQARIDVISIAEDYAVTLASLLNQSDVSQLQAPTGLTVYDHRLYISDWKSGSIIRLALDTLEPTVLAGPGGSDDKQRYFQPRQTTFDAKGNMYVATGGKMCGGKHLYSAGFCVVAVSEEGQWRKLVTRGQHIYPYGVTLTSTGFAVSWVSYAESTTLSLVQWYDLEVP